MTKTDVSGAVPDEITLKIPGLSDGYAQTEWNYSIGNNISSKYTLSFKLEPYPAVGHQPFASDYVLLLTVTK